MGTMAARTRPRGRQSVVNPLTLRRIIVGGAVFRRLMDAGFDQAGDILIRQRVIADNANAITVTVTEAVHPAYPDEILPRNSTITFRGRGIGRALNDFVFGGERWADTLGRFNVRIGPLELLQFNVVGAIGQAGVRRNPDDIDGEIQDAGEPEPALQRQQPLRADDPLRVPFSNIDLNAGDDGECVQRWLGYRPDECTPEKIIEEANRRRDNVMLLDLFNNIMLETPDAHKKHRAIKSALIYGNHVYPITEGKYLKLIQDPVRSVEEEAPEVETYIGMINWMNNQLVSEHAMMYRHNGIYHIANTDLMDGKWTREPPSAEPWLSEIIDAMPRCDGWSPSTLHIFKEGTLDLLHTAGGMIAYTNDVMFLNRYLTAWDMERAYHRVFTSLCSNNLGQYLTVPNPSIFDEFERVLACSGVIDNEHWYLMTEPPAFLGLSSSLVPGCTMRLLFDRGLAEPTHRISFKHETRHMRHKKTLENLDMTQQKTFARVGIGMFGRVIMGDSVEVKLENHDPDEPFDPWQIHWYRSKGFTYNEMTGVMCKNDDMIDIKNRMPLWCATVHGTNFIVLKRLLEIMDQYNALPVAIRVDGLAYENSHISTTDLETEMRKDPEEDGQLQPYLRWEPSVVKPMTLTNPRQYRSWDPKMLPTNNVTYTGPPGTGKTYAVHQLHKDNHIKLDAQLCFSNKGKQRLARDLPDVPAFTVHGFFDIYARARGRGLDIKRFKGMTIFVDEAQACTRDQWGYFAEAYYAGARFYFAMDPRQVGPVEEETIPVVSFMGEVKELTHDHRNDAALQVAREMFWDDDTRFNPDIKPHDARPLLASNIAYTNRTCRWINEWYAIDNNLKPGDPGKYLVNEQVKKHKLENGMLVHINTDHEHAIRMEPEEIIRLFRKKRKKGRGRRRDTRPDTVLSWGYATTAHSTIGETIKDPEQMGLWGITKPPDYTDDDMRRVLYTGMTRVEKYNQLQFRACPP